MTFVGTPALSLTIAVKLPDAVSGFGKMWMLGHGASLSLGVGGPSA